MTGKNLNMILKKKQNKQTKKAFSCIAVTEVADEFLKRHPNSDKRKIIKRTIYVFIKNYFMWKNNCYTEFRQQKINYSFLE